MELKNMLITGAGGFCGRNLTEHFQGKYNVFPMRHRDLDQLDQDAVKTFFDTHKIDVVINCTNVGGSRKTNYDTGDMDITKDNLKMFFNIVKSLSPDTYMIHFGSGAQYDKTRDLVKIAEDKIGERIPNDPYGFSKYVMSKYIEKADNITELIIFGLYGKYEDYSFKFISNAILKNILHMPITINQNVIFDFTYIDDFIGLVDRCVEQRPKAKNMNIVCSESVDLVTIANLINKVGEYKSEIIVVNDGLNIQYTGSNKRIQENLGEYKFTSYEDGIRNLYNYYKTNLHKMDLETIKSDPYLKFCTTK